MIDVPPQVPPVPSLPTLGDLPSLEILGALVGHSYAGLSTIQPKAKYSDSHTLRGLQEAVDKGYATVERNGRKKRWRLTPSGQAFLSQATGPTS
jgi:DNA-binding MarR family transcriptional regulator